MCSVSEKWLWCRGIHRFVVSVPQKLWKCKYPKLSLSPEVIWRWMISTDVPTVTALITRIQANTVPWGGYSFPAVWRLHAFVFGCWRSKVKLWVKHVTYICNFTQSSNHCGRGAEQTLYWLWGSFTEMLFCIFRQNQTGLTTPVCLTGSAADGPGQERTDVH